MASDASQALGATELAGAFVNPKGMATKMIASAAGRVTAGDAYEGSAGVALFGRVGYLAATSDEIALVKTKTGALKMKISSAVLATDFDEGKMLSHLKITFRDRTIWEFDVPKAGRKDARDFVGALEGSPH